MKWTAIGLGAAVLALAVATIAVTTRGGQDTTVVTRTDPSQLGVVTPVSTAKPVQPTVAAAKKPAPRAATPAPAKTCQGAGDESDPTGDDGSSACGSDGENENENESSRDDQAGDNDSGDDSRGDQAGDEQDGENDNGD